MLPPSPDDPGVVRADYAACRAVLRTGSRSFFAASLLLPDRVRQPASALYAFCRIADDAVDLAGGRADAIARLRERLGRIYAGGPLPNPVDRAFAATVTHFAIPRALPEALLEGLEWDVRGRRYRDLAALHDYAARVAGTVGVMMALVMGVRDSGPLARACDLGIAMQLSNIARDVGEDAREGRLYLPEQWLREVGIDPVEWLAQPRFDPALGAVVGRLLEAADQLYRRAEAGIAQLSLGCRPAIYGARFVYAEIGRELERQGLDSISRRAVVGGARKARLLAKAVLTTPAPRRSVAAPPLDGVRFLIDAVSAEPVASMPRALGFDDRIAWVIALFDRLERREIAGVGSRS